MGLVRACQCPPTVSSAWLTSTCSLGPEVVNEAVKVLETISSLTPDLELSIESHAFGGHAIDTTGEPLPASTLKACQEADAILMGKGNYLLDA